MFKQLVVLLLVTGVVLCNEAEQDQEEPVAAPIKSNKPGIGESLIDLALIGSKNLKRSFDESKPTLDFIGKRIEKRINDVRNNPAVQRHIDGIANNPDIQKVIETSKKQAETIGNNIITNPHIQAAQAKAKPVIEQGLNKVNNLINDAEKKRRALSKKLLDEHRARQEKLKGNVR